MTPSVPLLLQDDDFPPVETAREDGILAAGGDLSAERLLRAYRAGIFPWYDRPPIIWWYPDPRFILFPGELIVSKSMRSVLRRNLFSFTVNKAFEQVIRRCSSVPRRGQAGTWINPEIIRAYTLLHPGGYAVSAEAWQGNRLVGGLYGIRLGRVFFGESMFSLVSNASKAVFIQYVQQLQQEGVTLIDCQVPTSHLASLGAKSIPARTFKQLLGAAVSP